MKEIKDTQIAVQNVNLKIDPVVKESAEAVLANMGLNMSAYIGMCLRQLSQDREIPFAQKADPVFWSAEYRAYKAKRIIDSGIMEPVSLLYTSLLQSIRDMEADFSSFTLGHDSPELVVFKYVQGLAANLSFDKSIDVVHIRLSHLANKIELMLSGGKFDDDDYASLAIFKKYIELFKKYIELMDAMIVDVCHKIALDTPGLAELFYSIFDSPVNESCEITRENCFIPIASLFSCALDAYEASPESISIRYTGQVGGSWIVVMMDAASAEREALSKAKIAINYEID